MSDSQMQTGRLTAQTLNCKLDPTPRNMPDCNDLVELINGRVQPPIPVTLDDVHIRALRLVSDAINDHGGRFPRDEHERLCELIIDTPVLIGHDKGRLPVARNFEAQMSTEGDRQWVEVYFYWLRSPHGDRLANDIDSGVIKEGSIGFEFHVPECSVCGKDIRACEHVPGQKHFDPEGNPIPVHYLYRGISRVFETSLVYRGATPGTHFKTPVCAIDKSAQPDGELSAVVLNGGDSSTGLNRYRVALHHLPSAVACDELIIHSTERFDVGDRLTFTKGRWHRDDGREDHDSGTKPIRTVNADGAFIIRTWYSTRVQCAYHVNR